MLTWLGIVHAVTFHCGDVSLRCSSTLVLHGDTVAEGRRSGLGQRPFTGLDLDRFVVADWLCFVDHRGAETIPLRDTTHRQESTFTHGSQVKVCSATVGSPM